MKLGETKPYITWIVETDLIEYYNTTILTIIKDSTPEITPSDTDTTTTVDFLNFLVLISLIFIFSKIKRKL